jgi:hypothetical protein
LKVTTGPNVIKYQLFAAIYGTQFFTNYGRNHRYKYINIYLCALKKSVIMDLNLILLAPGQSSWLLGVGKVAECMPEWLL